MSAHVGVSVCGVALRIQAEQNFLLGLGVYLRKRNTPRPAVETDHDTLGRMLLQKVVSPCFGYWRSSVSISYNYAATPRAISDDSASLSLYFFCTPDGTGVVLILSCDAGYQCLPSSSLREKPAVEERSVSACLPSADHSWQRRRTIGR